EAQKLNEEDDQENNEYQEETQMDLIDVDDKRPFTQQKSLDEEAQKLNEEDDQENNEYQEETQMDLIDDETSKKAQQDSPQDLS
ncbi:hypothetical protein FIM61_07950, partial [Helicobacter pylori]